MVKWLCLGVLCAALFVAPCVGHHAVAGEYDFVTQQWIWEALGSHPLAEWLHVGYSLRCVCPEWVWKAGIVPSWVPTRQDYAIWAEVRYEQWSIKLTDWCKHWLSQSSIPPGFDDYGLTLRLQWEW